MKKIIFSCLVTIVCVFTFVCGSSAQEVMTVSGKDYTVFILCLDDAGDYCNQREFKQDTFQFHSDGAFDITSLEDQKEFIDTSDGNYNVSAAGFNGDYTVTTDFLLKKYEFSFSGFSIVDVLILGRFNVTYFEVGGFPPAYEQKGEAQAYFLGIRQ